MSRELIEATVAIVYANGYRTKVKLPIAVKLIGKGAAMKADAYDAIEAGKARELSERADEKAETAEKNTAEKAVRKVTARRKKEE